MKILISLLLLSTTLLPAHAQQQNSGDEKAVKQVIIDMFDALANRDTNLLKFYSTADVIILESGAVWNMDTLLLKIKPNPPADYKRINSFDFIKVEVKGKTAWASFHNKADITRNGRSGSIQWLESAVLVKINKEWKMKLLHSTVKKPATP